MCPETRTRATGRICPRRHHDPRSTNPVLWKRFAGARSLPAQYRLEATSMTTHMRKERDTSLSTPIAKPVVKEYFGLTVGQTIKTWSVMETIISVMGLVLTLLLSLVLVAAAFSSGAFITRVPLTGSGLPGILLTRSGTWTLAASGTLPL
jgi:hypothetical protein